MPLPEDLEPISGADEAVVERVKGRFGDAYRSAQRFRGELSIWVDPPAVPDALRYLKSDPELLYEYLTDITAVDFLNHLEPGQPRFEVVYILYSPMFHRRLLLKTRTNEEAPVPTATTVWRGANFMEREVYDMFGVKFSGHPDLRRLLTPDGWLGHPLRKDFPTQSAQFPNVES